MGKVSVRSSGVSTRSCAAGSSTSNMPIARRCKASMGGCACGCAASCAKGASGRDADAAQIISAGQTPILQSTGCSLVSQHVRKPSVRENGKTINWRAVCGRSACTVRREGKRSIRFPYPYPGCAALRQAQGLASLRQAQGLASLRQAQGLAAQKKRRLVPGNCRLAPEASRAGMRRLRQGSRQRGLRHRCRNRCRNRCRQRFRQRL